MLYHKFQRASSMTGPTDNTNCSLMHNSMIIFNIIHFSPFFHRQNGLLHEEKRPVMLACPNQQIDA